MRAFIPARVTLEPDRQDAIRSLSDIVEFHAEKNPDYLFCVQAEKKPGLDGYSLSRVTYTTLKWAITNCCQWLEAHLSHLQQRTRRGQGDADGSQGPIVLLMESDLGLAVYILALMRLGIPAVLLSTRLSATAIHHLIGRTGATTVIASQRLRSMLDEPTPAVDTKFQNGEPQNKGLQVFTAAGYQTFLNDLDSPLETNVSVQTTNPALILHSSGTSGLPKPIYCTHAHFLAFSQCHEFETAEQRQGLTVSSSPFFHVSASPFRFTTQPRSYLTTIIGLRPSTNVPLPRHRQNLLHSPLLRTPHRLLHRPAPPSLQLQSPADCPFTSRRHRLPPRQQRSNRPPTTRFRRLWRRPPEAFYRPTS